uniref:Uncharacterized protein n=1 Tax=Anguilla anguilla TaxID=7936 RepID=A0A0E9VDT8_ANGAN
MDVSVGQCSRKWRIACKQQKLSSDV